MTKHFLKIVVTAMAFASLGALAQSPPTPITQTPITAPLCVVNGIQGATQAQCDTLQKAWDSQSQSQPQPSGSKTNPNWAGAGVGYNTYASPQINGWAALAWQVSSKGLYNWSGWVVNSAKTNPFSVQTTAYSGLAIPCKTWSSITLWCFAAPGVAASATASNSTTVSAALVSGGMAVWHIGKSKFTLEGGAMPMVTNKGVQTTYLGGVGLVLR